MNTAVLTTTVCTLLVIFPMKASAQWSYSSDQRELQGKTVVDVGAVNDRSERVGTGFRYDPALKRDVYYNGRQVEWREYRGSRLLCFASAYLSSYQSKAAMLLVDASNNPYLATLSSSLSNIQVEVEVVIPITCPQ